jgi:hypothetical protein
MMASTSASLLAVGLGLSAPVMLTEGRGALRRSTLQSVGRPRGGRAAR